MNELLLNQPSAFTTLIKTFSLQLIMNRYLVNLRYAFNPNKPILFLRLASKYLQKFLTKETTVSYVDLQIGKRCNIRCPHCFVNEYTDDGDDRVSPEEYSKVVKEAMGMGAVIFSFQGGEPLMYPDLKEYVKVAHPEANIISIKTNGTMITKEKCKELKQMGVDILTVSVDKFRPMEYKVILDRVKLAQKEGMKVTISSVVTHENLRSEFIQEMIDFAEQNKIILMLILAAPSGKWEGVDSLMLNQEDLKFLQNIIDTYTYVRTDMDSIYTKHECPAGREIIYIKSDGNTGGCPFVPIEHGNVKDTNIGEIRHRIINDSLFKREVCVAGNGEFRCHPAYLAAQKAK